MLQNANERSKGKEEERKGRGRERKRKGKGGREIGSEALAETEKIANAPAGKPQRLRFFPFLPKLHFQFPFPPFLSSFFLFLFLSFPLPFPSTFRLRFKISFFALIPSAAKCVIWSLKFQNFLGEHAPDPPSGLGLRPRVTAARSHCPPNHPQYPSGYTPDVHA